MEHNNTRIDLENRTSQIHVGIKACGIVNNSSTLQFASWWNPENITSASDHPLKHFWSELKSDETLRPSLPGRQYFEKQHTEVLDGNVCSASGTDRTQTAPKYSKCHPCLVRPAHVEVTLNTLSRLSLAAKATKRLIFLISKNLILFFF